MKSKRWVWRILISPCSSRKQSSKRKKIILKDSRLKSHGSPKQETRTSKSQSPFVLLPKQSCTHTTKNGSALIVISLSNSINGIQVPPPPIPTFLPTGSVLIGSRPLGIQTPPTLFTHPRVSLARRPHSFPNSQRSRRRSLANPRSLPSSVRRSSRRPRDNGH